MERGSIIIHTCKVWCFSRKFKANYIWKSICAKNNISLHICIFNTPGVSRMVCLVKVKWNIIYKCQWHNAPSHLFITEYSKLLDSAINILLMRHLTYVIVQPQPWKLPAPHPAAWWLSGDTGHLRGWAWCFCCSSRRKSHLFPQVQF